MIAISEVASCRPSRADVSQRNVFTEHEINISVQRQIIAYQIATSVGKCAAWVVISKVTCIMKQYN